jgi:hypothetical protein
VWIKVSSKAKQLLKFWSWKIPVKLFKIDYLDPHGTSSYALSLSSRFFPSGFPADNVQNRLRKHLIYSLYSKIDKEIHLIKTCLFTRRKDSDDDVQHTESLGLWTLSNVQNSK